MDFNPFKKVELTLEATKAGQVVSSSKTIGNDDESKRILTEYLDAMINGKPISQITTYKHMSDYAKRALEELQKSTIDDELKKKQEKLQALINEVQKLEEEKERLSPLIDGLATDKNNIHREIKSKKQELQQLETTYKTLLMEKENIDKNLSDLRENGKSIVEKEMSDLRQTKMLEISKLQEDLDELKKNGVGAVNDEINEMRQKKIVAMEEFLKSLKQEGIEKVNNEVDEYESERKRKIAELEKREESLRLVIDSIESQYNDLVNKINDLIKSNNISSNSLPDGNVHDINIIKRESYLQTVALEAVAKQQIAERQLDKVIKLLAATLPKDIDLEDYLIKNVYGDSIKEDTKSM